MSKRRNTPTTYHNQELMHDTNEMFARIKVHLFGIGDDKLIQTHPEPTNHELDLLMNRILTVLRKDSEPMIKYKDTIEITHIHHRME